MWNSSVCSFFNRLPVVTRDLIKPGLREAELSIKIRHPICLLTDRHSCLAGCHMVCVESCAWSPRLKLVYSKHRGSQLITWVTQDLLKSHLMRSGDGSDSPGCSRRTLLSVCATAGWLLHPEAETRHSYLQLLLAASPRLRPTAELPSSTCCFNGPSGV